MTAAGWRLCSDTAPRAGVDQMARDVALMEWTRQHAAPALRLYTWAPACVTIGLHEPINLRVCRTALQELGADVVRRPTGGRAVWHEHDLTYAFCIPADTISAARSWYRAIHACIASALGAVGVRAELAADGPVAGLTEGPCFETAVGGEVLVNGCKVVGSAQVIEQGVLLQQGTVLLAGAEDQRWRMRRARGQPCAPYPRQTNQAVGLRQPMIDAMIDAFRTSFGDPEVLEPGQLDGPAALHRDRFADSAWTWGR